MCSILAYCSGQADYERVAEMLSRTMIDPGGNAAVYLKRKFRSLQR